MGRILLKPLENLPKNLKKSYCSRCFDFLSSTPDIDNLAATWNLNVFCKDGKGRAYLIYKYSNSLHHLKLGICMLCNIFLNVSVDSWGMDSGALDPHKAAELRTFEVAYFFKIGAALDVEETKIYKWTFPMNASSGPTDWSSESARLWSRAGIHPYCLQVSAHQGRLCNKIHPQYSSSVH